MRPGARFCDNCGENQLRKDETSPVDFNDGQIVRSTKMYISQQRLILCISLVGFGILALVMAATIPPMPSEPFGPADDYSFNTMVAVMGVVSLIMGVVIYVFGRSDQEQY